MGGKARDTSVQKTLEGSIKLYREGERKVNKLRVNSNGGSVDQILLKPEGND